MALVVGAVALLSGLGLASSMVHADERDEYETDDEFADDDTDGEYTDGEYTDGDYTDGEYTDGEYNDDDTDEYEAQQETPYQYENAEFENDYNDDADEEEDYDSEYDSEFDELDIPETGEVDRTGAPRRVRAMQYSPVPQPLHEEEEPEKPEEPAAPAPAPTKTFLRPLNRTRIRKVVTATPDEPGAVYTEVTYRGETTRYKQNPVPEPDVDPSEVINPEAYRTRILMPNNNPVRTSYTHTATTVAGPDYDVAPLIRQAQWDRAKRELAASGLRGLRHPEGNTRAEPDGWHGDYQLTRTPVFMPDSLRGDQTAFPGTIDISLSAQSHSVPGPTVLTAPSKTLLARPQFAPDVPDPQAVAATTVRPTVPDEVFAAWMPNAVSFDSTVTAEYVHGEMPDRITLLTEPTLLHGVTLNNVEEPARVYQSKVDEVQSLAPRLWDVSGGQFGQADRHTPQGEREDYLNTQFAPDVAGNTSTAMGQTEHRLDTNVTARPAHFVDAETDGLYHTTTTSNPVDANVTTMSIVGPEGLTSRWTTDTSKDPQSVEFSDHIGVFPYFGQKVDTPNFAKFGEIYA